MTRGLLFFFWRTTLIGWSEPKIEVVLQPGIAVDQTQRGNISKGIAQKALDPFVNPVARHLGRQCEIHSPLLPGGNQSLGGEERSFGLTAAHRSLDNQNTG